jgi:hypothetical protein
MAEVKFKSSSCFFFLGMVALLSLGNAHVFIHFTHVLVPGSTLSRIHAESCHAMAQAITNELCRLQTVHNLYCILRLFPGQGSAGLCSALQYCVQQFAMDARL